MSTVAQAEPLMTAEEFARRPDPGYPEELVRGRVVAMPPPKPRHGQVCLKIGRLLANFVEAERLGHVLSNDSGVITQRGPDTVRGADVSYYSHERVPPGPLPHDYLDVAPDLVVEVLSPSDRWPVVIQKVGEYLGAGVRLVVVLDPDERAAHVYAADRAPRVVRGDEALALPEVFGEEFRLGLREVFG
jgi:Uma2 family endonuclease